MDADAIQGEVNVCGQEDRVPPSRQAAEDGRTSQVTMMDQKFPWFEEIPVTYVMRDCLLCVDHPSA